jgi:anti-sigma B factor antagonist
MELEIGTTEHDGTCVVVVEGEVDLNTSPKLRTVLTKQIPRNVRAVDVDLKGVPYMDSSGVATLIEGLRSAVSSDAEFALVAPSAAVLKVLKLSRLDSVFTIREDG